LESAEHVLKLPGVGDMVREAIARLSTRPIRSQLLKLPDQTLEDLCMRLVDRTITFADCWEWLNGELLSIGSKAIDDNAVYRFKDNFLPLYEQVRTEHVRRIARLTVDEACAGQLGQVNRLTKVRLSELFAEKLLDIDDIDALKPGQVANIIAALGAYDAGAMKQQEFELKAQQAEQRAAKLEQEVEKLRLDNADRERKLQAAANAVKAEAETKAAKTGGKVSIDDVRAMVDKVIKGEAV
jgi:hypothetical protein